MKTSCFASIRATDAERSRQLPSDTLIPEARAILTHAITISAQPQEIWPWLVQMGAGRGGWYSYDFVDNGGQASSTQIMPAFQQIAPGDLFPALPSVEDAFFVEVIEPDRNLILVVPDPNSGFRVSWEFLLQPFAQDQTRLIVRGRVSAKWLERDEGKSPFASGLRLIERVYSLLAKVPWGLMFPFAAFGHHLMQARQLRGIKHRAECL